MDRAAKAWYKNEIRKKCGAWGSCQPFPCSNTTIRSGVYIPDNGSCMQEVSQHKDSDVEESVGGVDIMK